MINVKDLGITTK